MVTVNQGKSIANRYSRSLPYLDGESGAECSRIEEQLGGELGLRVLGVRLDALEQLLERKKLRYQSIKSLLDRSHCISYLDDGMSGVELERLLLRHVEVLGRVLQGSNRLVRLP